MSEQTEEFLDAIRKHTQEKGVCNIKTQDGYVLAIRADVVELLHSQIQAGEALGLVILKNGNPTTEEILECVIINPKVKA